MCSIIFETKGKAYLPVGEIGFWFETTEDDGKKIKHEIFIGFNDVKFPFARKEKNILCLPIQKNVPYILIKNKKIEKGDDLYEYLLKTDAELKRYDDECQDVRFGANFPLFCKINE